MHSDCEAKAFGPEYLALVCTLSWQYNHYGGALTQPAAEVEHIGGVSICCYARRNGAGTRYHPNRA